VGAEGDREDQQSSAPGEEEGGEQADEEAGGQQLQLRPQDHQVQVDARLPLKHVLFRLQLFKVSLSFSSLLTSARRTLVIMLNEPVPQSTIFQTLFGLVTVNVGA
jgi:hypothetical protein